MSRRATFDCQLIRRAMVIARSSSKSDNFLGQRSFCLESDANIWSLSLGKGRRVTRRVMNHRQSSDSSSISPSAWTVIVLGEELFRLEEYSWRSGSCNRERQQDYGSSPAEQGFSE